MFEIPTPKDAVLPRKFFVTNPDGTIVFASISPCAWMHDDYGMQVQLSLKEGECNAASTFVNWKTRYKDCTPAELTQHITEWVHNDANVQELRAKQIAWDKHAAEYQAGAEVRKQAFLKEQAAEDAKMKAQGHTHRINGWVHPKQGGDDYPFTMYGQNVTEVQVIKWLKKKSSIIDQFKITVLS